MPLKTCHKCNLDLPATLEYFYAKEHGQYGVRAVCRACDKEERERNKEIIKEKSAKYYRENRERINESNRRYYESNRDSVCKRTGENYRKDPLRHNALTKAWHIENREYHNNLCKRHFRENKGLYRAKTAKYRAQLLRAIPAWADIAKINVTYLLAQFLSTETGTAFEVDHLYPIQGKSVCGLHTENNLRVIPMRDNRSKGNSMVGGTYAI